MNRLLRIHSAWMLAFCCIVTIIAIGDYGPWVLCVNNTSRIELPA